MSHTKKMREFIETMCGFFEDNYQDPGVEIFGYVSWQGIRQPTESAKFVNEWVSEARKELEDSENERGASPLVLAADQLAQAAEKNIELATAGDTDVCRVCEWDVKRHSYTCPIPELRTALSNYRKVREGL